MSRLSPNAFLEVTLLVILSCLWGASFTLVKIAVETIPTGNDCLWQTRHWGHYFDVYG